MAGLGLERELATYLAHVTVERGLARNTIAAYRRDLGRYVEYLTAQQVVSVADASPTHVSEFAQAVSSGGDGHTPLAPASAARTVVAVRGFTSIEASSIVQPSATAKRCQPRTAPARLPKALSTDAVESLLEAAGVGEGLGPLRDKALLEVLYASGARVSEAIGLDVDDVSLEPGAEAVLLRGKGRKERIVPMGHFAADAVNAYLVRARPALAAAGKGEPALFLNTRGGRLSRQSGWTIIKAAAQRAGIDHVSPHTLRHSCATHLLRGGADIRVVQELLGHASVTTTQVYTLVTRDAMREVYQSAHPRARSAAPGVR